MKKERLIDVRNLTKRFKKKKQELIAVNDLSFAIHKGETLGLVGESGCGKSTTGRCLLRLETVSSGDIFYKGENLLGYSPQELFHFRRQAQIIFQDPYSSLNPRMSAEKIIAEPLHIHEVMDKEKILHAVAQLAEKVGLDPSALKRFPHEFSGGQRQRIGIARALALNPQFIVCDEPISALDVPIQAQIINLLKDLQQEFNLTYLFIAHNLAMVKYISDRIAVMYLGHLVELSEAEELYRTPLHPYTQALLASIPSIDPKAKLTPYHEPTVTAQIKGGCPFVNRCPHAQKRCYEEVPLLKEVSPGHFVACHLFRTPAKSL